GGLDAVAGALVHLLALLVHHPAVAQHRLVGGHALAGHAGQQAGLEPAAELVRALHIQVGGIAQLGPLPQDGAPGGAGVEPDVHDVGVLGPLGAAAVLAHFARGDDLLGLVLIPGVRALAAEQVADRLDGGVGDVVLTALFAVDSGDGHAPGALAADASVAAVPHHAVHPVVAPLGHPLVAVHRLLDILLEGVDGAEPLLGGAEDDGVVA